MSFTTLARGTQTFESASGLEGGKRRKLITNLLADRLLSERPMAGMGSFPIWTGTVVAYPGSGKMFGDSVEYSCRPCTYVLDTSEFKGVKGAALVFEDFELRTDGAWKVFLPRGRPALIERFPQESGWYGMHEHSGVPVVKETGEKRFLFRLESARVGPVSRDFGPDGAMKHDVLLHHRLSQKMGAIIIEQPGSNVIRLEVAGRK